MLSLELNSEAYKLHVARLSESSSNPWVALFLQAEAEARESEAQESEAQGSRYILLQDIILLDSHPRDGILSLGKNRVFHPKMKFFPCFLYTFRKV